MLFPHYIILNDHMAKAVSCVEKAGLNDYFLVFPDMVYMDLGLPFFSWFDRS
jgi:hypothetical protein